jgi:hypothetical protein
MGRFKMVRTPNVDRLYGFYGKTLAVCRAGEDPPGFGSGPKWRLNGAFEVGESHFAEEISRKFLFDDPIPEPK